MAHFETKIKRVIRDKKGNDKEIAEVYFVENAVSFGDAETRIQTYWNCECDVVAVTMSRVMDIVNPRTDEEESIYKAIIASVFLDDNENEKEMKYPVLVFAKSLEEATKRVIGYMDEGLGDMNLHSITKTKIVEVI
jgi:hypothetical protein